MAKFTWLLKKSQKCASMPGMRPKKKLVAKGNAFNINFDSKLFNNFERYFVDLSFLYLDGDKFVSIRGNLIPKGQDWKLYRFGTNPVSIAGLSPKQAIYPQIKGLQAIYGSLFPGGAVYRLPYSGSPSFEKIFDSSADSLDLSVFSDDSSDKLAVKEIDTNDEHWIILLNGSGTEEGRVKIDNRLSSFFRIR